jgi:hypothetical protein
VVVPQPASAAATSRAAAALIQRLLLFKIPTLDEILKSFRVDARGKAAE